jgi:hypothetical protein
MTGPCFGTHAVFMLDDYNNYAPYSGGTFYLTKEHSYRIVITNESNKICSAASSAALFINGQHVATLNLKPNDRAVFSTSRKKHIREDGHVKVVIKKKNKRILTCPFTEEVGCIVLEANVSERQSDFDLDSSQKRFEEE